MKYKIGYNHTFIFIHIPHPRSGHSSLSYPLVRHVAQFVGPLSQLLYNKKHPSFFLSSKWTSRRTAQRVTTAPSPPRNNRSLAPLRTSCPAPTGDDQLSVLGSVETGWLACLSEYPRQEGIEETGCLAY